MSWWWANWRRIVNAIRLLMAIAILRTSKSNSSGPASGRSIAGRTSMPGAEGPVASRMGSSELKRALWPGV